MSAGHATPVCILAGGLSTRLRPLTQTLPKPMLPVGGRPFLHLLLDHLGSLGFRRFILAVCYRREVIREYFGDGSAFGWRIEYSVEDRPLKTGGAVLAAQRLWGRRVLVLNGDTFLAGDWPAMLEFHDRAGLPATLAVVHQERPDRYGRVVLSGLPEGGRDDRTGRPGGGIPRVMEFREKSPGQAGWINGGAYVLDESAFAGRKPGEAFSLETDLLPALAGRIGAFPCRADFVDIGTFGSLEEFRRSVARRAGQELKVEHV